MYKPLLQLASASLLAQIISFSVMPIITRLHSPESLGQYQFFTTVALVLTPFVTGSFQFAIKSSKTRHRALVNLKLAMQFSFLFFCLLFLVSLLSIPFLLKSSLSWFALYSPLVVFFVLISANFQFAMSYLTNERSYSGQAKYSVTKSVISNSLKLAFSYFSKSAFSLVLAVVLTEVFQVARLIRHSYRSLLGSLLNFNLKFLKRGVYKERRYPTYVTFTSVLAILMNWYPILITGFFYGPEYAGFLGLAFMVVNTPVYPFIGALKNVCFGELARDFSPNKCVSVYRKSFAVAIFPCVLGITVLGFYGGDVFSFVFSKEWEVSGFYAFVCFFPISLSFLLSPIYSTLNHFLGFQKVFFVINLSVLMAGVIATSYVGYIGGDFTWFLVCFAATMSINHLLLFAFSLYFTSAKLKLEKNL